LTQIYEGCVTIL